MKRNWFDLGRFCGRAIDKLKGICLDLINAPCRCKITSATSLWIISALFRFLFISYKFTTNRLKEIETIIYVSESNKLSALAASECLFDVVE